MGRREGTLLLPLPREPLPPRWDADRGASPAGHGLARIQDRSQGCLREVRSFRHRNEGTAGHRGMKAIARLLDLLDDRTGFRGGWRRIAEEPIPGGSRWAFVFGSALLSLLLLQGVTGVLLAMSYAPSATDAWSSVFYIETKLAAGALIRGMHHHGASLVVLLALLHGMQTFLFGAYKRPREFNWIVGVFLFLVILAFGLTGYLLPWDQKGYWATQVATRIVGSLPWVGKGMQWIVQGGSGYGNLTLTRFYAIHVFLLPLLLVVLVTLHLFLFRRHGVTPSWRLSAEAAARSEPFFPGQAWKDLVAATLILVVLLLLGAYRGAPLTSPADPSRPFEARPEWYFLFLFQLLKFFEGPYQIIATVVLPGLAILLLLALPFLDRSPERSLTARRTWCYAMGALLLGVIVLSLLARLEDAGNKRFLLAAEEEARFTKAAFHLAEMGVPPQGPLALYENDPIMRGRRLFRERNCIGCHRIHGIGGTQGPELTGYLSRAWFIAFLEDPDHFFGNTPSAGIMPSFRSIGRKRLERIAEALVALSDEPVTPPIDPVKAKQGRHLIENGDLEPGDCTECHLFDDPEGVGIGPNLTGIGTRQWLRRFIENPGDPVFFGDTSAMPPFADYMNPRDIEDLVSYLLHLRAEATPLGP
ncbi:MAG: cytochrome B6 [Deltaproteobacteria bacterium]|nr:MAG: cytochrome B6 [Deltaproteobacteria bacterium]